MYVLELGNTISPAYAGMILAEQGHLVEKWMMPPDPILRLHRGAELAQWLNARKTIRECHARDVLTIEYGRMPDVIIDNFRPSTLEKWGIDPQELAERHGIIWVSMRSEVGEVSFDLIAQARSWLEYAHWTPFYIGDTSGGLWLAFKALSLYAQGAYGHYILGQASCMQKLVEGELIIEESGRARDELVWNPDAYRFLEDVQEAVIHYKGQEYIEPVRDTAWKREHLWHKDGRILI